MSAIPTVEDSHGTPAPAEVDGVDLKNDGCPVCACEAFTEFPAGHYHCDNCGSSWAGDSEDANLGTYFGPAVEDLEEADESLPFDIGETCKACFTNPAEPESSLCSGCHDALATDGGALDWPTGFERTNATNRTRNNRYEASLRDSIDDLEAELERLAVDHWRLSTAARHQKRNPKYPYADASPDDPSAVVRWSMDGDQFAVACDAYSRLRDNVRTLYLYIREKRKMEQRPVETGESEFANARLPSGDDDAVVAHEPPHEVLGVKPDADPDVVREAFREMVHEVHPDHGGSEAEFKRVKDAKEAMLDE